MYLLHNYLSLGVFAASFNYIGGLYKFFTSSLA